MVFCEYLRGILVFYQILYKKTKIKNSRDHGDMVTYNQVIVQVYSYKLHYTTLYCKSIRPPTLTCIWT